MGPSKRMRSLLSDCSKPDHFAGFVRNSEAFAIAQFSLAATCSFEGRMEQRVQRRCDSGALLFRSGTAAEANVHSPADVLGNTKTWPG
jgi:hypothetical protein